MKMTGRMLQATLMAGMFSAAAAAPLLVHTACAQAPSFRSVTGTVTDKGGGNLKGAVVHLKDTRSLAQRTFITADDGAFRFAQLSATTDYDIWADLNGKKTSTKSISSFDTKKTIDVSLKMPE